MAGDNFAGRLRELRNAAGLTKADLAAKCGLTADGITKLERGGSTDDGGRRPSWDTVLALAAALGVTCEEFTKAPTTDIPAQGPGRPPKAEKPASKVSGKTKPAAGKTGKKGKAKSS